MALNPLPPQAYTKDILQKAYSWLQTQDESVRQLASTSEILVSLYLKTHRDGEGFLQRPSVQNFKNELRHLAPMMDEFEKSSGRGTTEVRTHSAPVAESQLVSSNMVSNSFEGSPRPNSIPESNHRSNMNVGESNSGHSPIIASSPINAQSNLSHSGLDQKSMELISEVKKAYNLSNDLEALRMLISLGYKRAIKMINID